VISAKHHGDAIDAGLYSTRTARHARSRVQLLLPVAPRGDTELRVEIEEHRAVAGRAEARDEIRGDRVVGTAVADEQGTHGPH